MTKRSHPADPRKKAEHMAAPTSSAREENPCQPGAVHTWHIRDKARRLLSSLKLDQVPSFFALVP
jgi:hypothetical protein